MKKITILGLGLLSAIALSSAAFLAMPGTVKEAKAISPNTITADQFEVSMLESYVETADTSSVDRPLGTKLFAKHLYDGHGSNTMLDQDITLNGDLTNDLNTLKWRIGAYKAYFQQNVMRLILRAGTSSVNIFDSTRYPEETFPDEYKLANLVHTADPSNTVRGSAMISPSFSSFDDITITWRSCSCRRLFVCYQLDGETDWKILKQFNMQDSGYIIGNFQGTRGWDAYGFTTIGHSFWNESELKGNAGRIAFVLAHHINDDSDMQLSSVLINANKSAVKYLNVQSYQYNLCNDGDLRSLKLTSSNYSHCQDLFQLATERADADFLAEYDVGGTKTSETNILGFYNYLVGSIPGLGSAKVSSARFGSTFTSGNSNTIVTVIVLASVSAVAVTSFIVFKKKKHN